MTPTSNIYALITKVRFEPSTNLSTSDSTKNYRLRFGIRTLLKGNATVDYMITKASAVGFFETVLPAGILSCAKTYLLAWPSPNQACGIRAGYQALLEICDPSNSCSMSVGPTFYVQQPLNSSSAEMNLIELARADVNSGDLKNGIEKLEIVGFQRCNMTFDRSLADWIIQKIVDMNQNTT